MASRTIGAIGTRLLSPTSFICRQCQGSQAGRLFRTNPLVANFSTSKVAIPITRQWGSQTGQKVVGTGILGQKTSSRILDSFRFAQAQYRRLSMTVVKAAKASKAKATEQKGFFPETSEKVVGYWLLGSAGLVFAIVILGGLTRLTESGLSITEWKPVTGSLPPLSEADWEAEFAKYKDSPEFRILNPTMDLSEYKFIYYMEWTHRLLGRVIGLSFVLPAIYFVARRKVSGPMAWKLAAISLGIGFQGFIGWWMVKSGLQDDLFQEPGSHPRVSQYRLTAHLGAAFLVYSAMFYSGISVLRENKLLKDPRSAVSNIMKRGAPGLLALRIIVGAMTALIFTTAMSGALVAGLDAGLVYNEFPYMGNGFAPPKSELLDPFYSREPAPHNDLVWRNMLENPVTVQLDHRVLAMTTFTAILALFGYGRFLRSKKLLTTEAAKGITGLVHLVTLQVALGISTLIYLVPHSLASLHQANSLLLLTGALVLGSRVWVPRHLLRLAGRRVGKLPKAKNDITA